MRKTLLLMAMLVGCGGDDGGSTTSGVTQTKGLLEMTAAEVTTFCKWAIDAQGGPDHQEMCGDSVTFTVDTYAECETEYGDLPAGCSTVTVAEAEACINAIAGNLCMALSRSECMELFQCQTGGQ